MKKILLLGFGIVAAGTALAATIGPVSIAEKFANDYVSHEEFNLMSEGLNSISDVFNGVDADASMITFPKSLRSSVLCIGADCRTSWPSVWTTTGSDAYFSGGNIGIGVTNPGESLDILGNVQATAFLYSSDERLKKNISPIKDALGLVNELEGVSFDWRESGVNQIGFIAQDVEKIIPALVTTNSMSGMKSVAYGNITAVLVEAIKEQQKQIDKLRTELELLK